jgi:hypothetical protein
VDGGDPGDYEAARRLRWGHAGVLFEYAGPYFVSCDHGCYHGEDTHGQGAARGGCASGEERVSPALVVQTCLRWLGAADAVFCWLDDPTAHGTVAELGYATGIGKPVFLYTPPGDRLRDLWFVQQMIRRHARAATVGWAFEHFAEHMATIVASDNWGSSAGED